MADTAFTNVSHKQLAPLCRGVAELEDELVNFMNQRSQCMTGASHAGQRQHGNGNKA
jgi:hypothetical protein